MIINDYHQLPNFRKYLEKSATELAHKYPHARRTIAKARDLCEQRAVLVLNNGHWPLVAQVASETDIKTAYDVHLAIVTANNGQPVKGLSCDCKGNQYNPVYMAGKPQCKHTLATHIETHAQTMYYIDNLVLEEEATQ